LINTMPSLATRSVSDFRKALEETAARDAVVELALAYPPKQEPNADPNNPAVNPQWRVRLLDLDDEELIIERPAPQVSANTPGLEHGLALDATIGSGASRWTFRTQVIARQHHQLNAKQKVAAIRLAAPTRIRSAQRRSFFRVSMANASAQPVHLWALFNPATCVPAEKANQALHEADPPPEQPPHSPLPAIGDHFTAELVDISGNGLGLSIGARETIKIEKHRLYWVQLQLPDLAWPLLFVAQLVHVRHDRAHRRANLGMQLVYKHHPPYQKFVEDMICRFTVREQRRQLQRQR
jgi:c-di-GMP-binding flagellar brake protein YcgR